MKNYISCIAIALVGLGFSACEFDNQPAPEIVFEGNFTYNNQVVPMMNGRASLSFYEDAYELNDRFTVHSNQNGKFSELIFAGDYDVVLDADRGAYEDNSDTLSIKVTGNTNQTWEIVPFYFVNDVGYSVSGSTLAATANISKTSTRDLEYVSLLVSRVIICDRVNKEDEIQIPAAEIDDLTNISISADLTDWTQDYCFVRVGVKSDGNTYYNYSQVTKVNLK
ncbi:MAG: DUF3823 domain-containing protein [Cytophagales bacterium]|nr:DUF3823 domain-containing protein [Cytophagales bacterium]